MPSVALDPRCKPYKPRGAARELFYAQDSEVLLDGPAGCVAADTPIRNPLTGRETSIADLCDAGEPHVIETAYGPMTASAPFLKGVGELYEITTETGRKIVTSGHHRLLTADGWLSASRSSRGLTLICSASPAPSTSGFGPRASLLDALRYLRTAQGSLADCRACCRSCGAQLRSVPVVAQVCAPSQGDEAELCCGCCGTDGRERRPAHSFASQYARRHATPDCSFPSGGTAGTEWRTELLRRERAAYLNETGEPFRSETSHLCSILPEAPGDDPKRIALSISNRVQLEHITQVRRVGEGPYYDMHVPYAEHYFACGMIHHNTGKTRAILEKLHYLASNHPNVRALIARKTRESMTESVLVTYENHVVESGSPVLEGASRQMRQAYTYPNGSTIVVGGLDKPSKIMSTEYDVIAVFEATETTENDWEMLLTRLRNGKLKFQQAIADCNPGAPTHWLNKRAESGRMRRLLSRHEDNPAVTPEYLERLSSLTGVRRDRLYLGRWVAAEGVVYADWDARIHLIERFQVPDEWTRYRTIDFGFAHPFVCLWAAQDSDGRLYIYRAIYRTKTLVSDHATRIVSLSGGEIIESGAGRAPRNNFEATIADPEDAEGRATLAAHGIHTIAARKAVEAGIQCVTNRLRIQADGKPRLYIMRDSVVDVDESLRSAGLPYSPEQEFDSYVWKRNTSGNVSREEPVKEYDHAMDALRYLCMHLDGGSGVTLDVVSLGRTAAEEYAEVLDETLWSS